MACDQDMVDAIVKKHLEAMAAEAQQHDICASCITVQAVASLYYTALVHARRHREPGAAAGMMQEALNSALAHFMVHPDPEDPSTRGKGNKKGMH